MDAQKVSIIADLTAAYEPEIGVSEFTRKFEFTAPDGFVVSDSVKLEKPQIITSFLHADSKIVQNGKNAFEFEPGGTSLLAEILAPKKFATKIEENILTAPGKPGSVDKGEREKRGWRVAISTDKPVKEANFLVKFKIKR